MEKKLIVQNIGWQDNRAENVKLKLAFIIYEIDKMIGLKNPIVVHLIKDNNEDGLRAEYDEGVILMYERTPDWRGDFLHELCHQLVRYDNLGIVNKLRIKKIRKELEENKGDGRIFLQKHTYSKEKEVLSTFFKWYMLGKIFDRGYLEILNNYHPFAVEIVESVLNSEKLEKSKKYPIGFISSKTGLKKVAEGKWAPVKKDNINEEEIKSFNAYFWSSFDDINKTLRGYDPLNNVDHHIKNIDNVIKRNKIKNKILYRGLSKTRNSKEFINEIKLLEIGDSFKDPAFISTSTNKNVAENFAGTYNDKGIVLKLNLNGNVNGIKRKYVTNKKSNEDEILLDRNLNFKVINKKIKDELLILELNLLEKDNIKKSVNILQWKDNLDLIKSKKIKNPDDPKFTLQGKIKFQKMDIGIENKKGSYRKGKDKDDHEWKTYMHYPYGFIYRTKGKDKDHLDCYIGPNKKCEKVFIVHQNNPVTKKYDEDKVMLGFDSYDKAKKAYLKQYDRPDFFGTMDEMNIDEFKKKIFSKKFKGVMIKSNTPDKNGIIFNIKSIDKPLKHIDCVFRHEYKTFEKLLLKSKSLVIDIDGTIFKYNEYKKNEWGLPVKGVQLALKKFKKDGYKIILFTARKKDEEKKLKQHLEKYGIIYDKLKMGKPIAEYYIDDKGLQFKNDWRKIETQVLKSLDGRLISDKNDLLKAKALPIGTVRTWKGRKFQKVKKGKWNIVIEKKEEKIEVKKEDLFQDIPIKGLNKDIDFKANEEFLNEEMKSFFNEDYEKLLYNEDYENAKDQINIAERTIEDLKNAKKDNKEKIIASNGSEYLKEEYNDSIDFQEYIISQQKKLIKKIEKEKRSIESYESFAKNLTPVHSLSIDKFLRVLKSNGLKSLENLDETSLQKGVAFIESEIRPKYGNKTSNIIYNIIKKERKDYGDFGFFTAKEEIKLRDNGVSKEDIKRFESKIENEIISNKQGSIELDLDKKLGTNKHIFSIIGTNGNGSGYGEISIILKQDIMEHPDFNMTPVAATSFYSGEMYDHRNWAKNKNIDRIEHFHKSKLNAKSNPEYYKYMAKDIGAQGSIDDYNNKNLHGKWEGHLPSFVPINQFAEIIMTEQTKQVLNDEYFIKKYPDYKSFDENKKEKLYNNTIKELNKKIDITILKSSNEIIPYMEKGFKNGKWGKK